MLQQDDVETIKYKHVNRGIGENDDETYVFCFWGVGVGGLNQVGINRMDGPGSH